jgi:hypothetical protein
MTLYKLIALGVLVLIILGAVAGAIHVHDNKVRAKEAAIWKPRLDAMTKDKETAVAANVSLQGDVARIDQERQLCSAGVQALGNAQKAAETVKAKALLAAGGKIAELSAHRDALEALLTQPATEGTCDERLAKIDAANDAVGGRRLHDHAPTDGGKRSQDAPADKGAGRDTLRLSK